jgi:tetratricopeptide (TPR) repeat protein
MSGPGGMGAVPSSRLTRILQEKAEELKRKRQAGEVLLKESEERVAQLDRLGIVLPEVPERSRQLRELVRRSDWEAVELQARALLDYLASHVADAIERRRRKTVESVERLSAAGVAVPAAATAEIEALAHPSPDAPWADTLGRLVRVEEELARAGVENVSVSQARATALAAWAGLTGDRLADFSKKVERAVEPAKEGLVADALTALAALEREGLPEAKAKHDASRATAESRVAIAKEHGASANELEAALRADGGVAPEMWPETVPAIDQAVERLGELLRERTAQVLGSLRLSLDSLPEYGTDPTEARVAVDAAISRLPFVPATEIPALLAEARRAAEEPIVAVVAALLDEVRPRISEARRLGRDPSEVFAAMNRAREALRLKIYSEALAASQEAAERVTALTQDLDAARDELLALEGMVERFHKSGFVPEGLDASLGRARNLLEKSEVDQARTLLRETVVQLGRDALKMFLERWTALDRIREYAREHGFLTPEAGTTLDEVRMLLDQGDLGGGAELLGRAETELRNAAAPYVERRVQEMEQGFVDITDDALTAPVRRLLADADVTLRVKGDLIGAIESLRKAERDFASVFAVHASALVDLLEEERRVLESMGGAGDEIQRQIDEVQQIFNMGDFVKASRASQEIRTRAQQQQLLRGEEAISHAKLALVELETLGLDLGKFRSDLEEAQSAARAGHYAEAHRLSQTLESTAVRTRTEAQSITDDVAHAQEQLGDLRELGVDPESFYEPIRAARLSVQSLDFDAARATMQVVQQKLSEAAARAETDRLFVEIDRLIEDGRRLSAPMDPFTSRLHSLRTERATAPAEATRTATRILHEELVAILVPILEENLQTLERDLDIARGAGVDLDRIVAPLAEARRRISLPVPVGAAALLDAARAEFIGTRGLVEHAERVAKRAREAIAEADLLHVDVGHSRTAMEQVESALGRREYARAIELGGPLEREVIQATYHHVSKTLAGFRATVTRLRNEGGDTTMAENLLHQARMALDESRPVDAVQLASRSEAELERAELQRRIAEGSIEAAERSLASAAKDGVVAPSAVAEVETARKFLEKHAYPDVLEHAILASDTLVASRESHRRAKEAFGGAESQVHEAAGFGANVQEPEARLSEARQLVEKGQYPEAIRASREATELGRWAIERLFAGPIGEMRRLVDAARKEGLTSEVDSVEAVVMEAEAALRAREWKIAREAIGRADSASRKVFESIVEVRWQEVEGELARCPPPTEAESARQAEVAASLAAQRASGDFASALVLMREELTTARRRRRESIEAGLLQLKEQLWVGERLGVDTTPAMQTFSESRVALDAGRLNESEALSRRANESLEHSIVEPFTRRFGDLLTEINFAAEGLRVSVGPVREHYEEIDGLAKSGHPLEAGRLLLAAEEDLALRKSLHRELMNLHYLIDAALGRAGERRADTSEARALLAESVRLRETDYPAALEKARDALRRLQGDAPPSSPAPAAEPVSNRTAAPPAESAQSSGGSSSTPFWPFRRSPPQS